MSNRRLDTLNKAYYFGEYDLIEYRELRSKLIDEVTHADENPTQKISEPSTHQDTIKMTASANAGEKKLGAVTPLDHDRHRGPSALQFLWVSIAIILFIYMYTAAIE